jgi:hypothetical protein
MPIEDIAILVTACEGPWGHEMSRLPHFLGNRLKDGCEDIQILLHTYVLDFILINF